MRILLSIEIILTICEIEVIIVSTPLLRCKDYMHVGYSCKGLIMVSVT